MSTVQTSLVKLLLCWFPPTVSQLGCSSNHVVLYSVDSFAYIIWSSLMAWCCCNLTNSHACSWSMISLFPLVLILLGPIMLDVAPLSSVRLASFVEGWAHCSLQALLFLLSMLLTLIVSQLQLLQHFSSCVCSASIIVIGRICLLIWWERYYSLQ